MKEVQNMPKPVLNVEDADSMQVGPEGSERFGAKLARIGSAIGSEGLGCTYAEVAPGKRAFPCHNHLANDEIYVVMAGEGTYRLGDEEFPVRAGDICAAPRGDASTAHQMVNTGSEPLKYVCISTMRDPEVVEYPDSGKFAAIAVRPGPDFFRAHLRYIGRTETSLDYYDGEEL